MPFTDVRAVLFDLDGTLIHSPIDFAAMRAAVLDLVRNAGFDPVPHSQRDILTVLAAIAPLTADPATFLLAADNALTAIELRACEEAVEADGAVETLAWLRGAGITVGIVTRNSRPAVARMLETVLLPYDVLLTRADTPRVKPDPLHLHLALEQLGATPERAVMIGDHPMDVQGGRAAGMRTLGVLAPGRPEDFFAVAAPDGVLSSLPELRLWIDP